MKVIQALARYFPDKCGGIQVNLKELLPELQARDIELQIAAATIALDQPSIYKYDNVEVYRYPVSPAPKKEPNHGQFTHGQFAEFANWLSQQQADVYHQHHWEVLCGLPHLRQAKALGMKTVITIHYPLPICQRTTMMLHGQQVCDGKIDVVRCSQCADTLTQKLPPAIVHSLSYLPPSILSRLPLPISAYLPNSIDNGNLGRFVRPLVVPSYVAARKSSLQEMAKFSDRIIAVCDWLYQALLINGIPKEKLVLNRYGIAYNQPNQSLHAKLKSANEPLKVVFLGRWDQYKGIDILVKAVKNIPSNVPIELIIHGIAQDETYRRHILKLIDQDPRIRIEKQLTREEIPQALANYHILAVPSQWLETGPLVVLEAHALSLPVIGSNLGGIAERVKHGIDGWLVPANDTQAWTQALQKLATDINLLNQLRQGIQPVRTISMQATDLANLYISL